MSKQFAKSLRKGIRQFGYLSFLNPFSFFPDLIRGFRKRRTLKEKI